MLQISLPQESAAKTFTSTPLVTSHHSTLTGTVQSRRPWVQPQLEGRDETVSTQVLNSLGNKKSTENHWPEDALLQGRSYFLKTSVIDDVKLRSTEVKQ